MAGFWIVNEVGDIVQTGSTLEILWTITHFKNDLKSCSLDR
jgi:hypothetical protein